MKIICIAILGASLHLLGWAAPSVFPKDVSTFLEDRELCDHWRGEYGFDDERQADINWSVCRSCPGTDAKLANLKKKYRANTKIIEKLGELESKIEGATKAEVKQICKNTRKPKWMK